ncbi:MAG: desulfoferrodoxin FeS4 iron-binding domain-containing protein [Bacillota bacterium]|nr:desulfoferrodoxin FeS4 iron-binding domain-containing protein [Bacillota bacterium]
MPNAEFAILMCQRCGTVVRVLKPGPGTVYCCEEPMVQINQM